MPDTGKTLFYPAWVSTHAGRRSPYCWGKPCDTPAEARKLGRAEVDAGNASMCFVVRFEGGERTPLPHMTYPGPVRQAVLHYEAIWVMTDPAHPAAGPVPAVPVGENP